MFFIPSLVVATIIGFDNADKTSEFENDFFHICSFARDSVNILNLEDVAVRLDKAMSIDPGKNQHMSLFLKKLKYDLKVLAGMSPMEKQVFEKNINRLLVDIDKLVSPKSSAKFKKELRSKLKESTWVIIEPFKRGSFFDLLVSSESLIPALHPFSGEDCRNLIDEEINRFKKTEWNETPFLDSFYLLHCANLRSLQDYRALLEMSQRLGILRGKLYRKDNSVHLAHQSYIVESLSGLKKDSECIAYFKTIPEAFLASEDVLDFGSQSTVYSAVSDCYSRAGKFNEAISYQELALSKTYSIVKSRDHRFVAEMAIKLRDKLVEAKDWASVRTLEERYTLKPLPKQQGEK